MSHIIDGIISFLVALALTLLYFHYKRRRQQKTSEDQVEYPRIARVKMHPICCPTCNKPLNHNDLVVWSEKKSGWQSPSSHADCLVFIRHPDGTTTRLNGEKVSTNSSGGILETLPVGALLLTEAEWDSWAPPKLEVEISPDRRVIQNI